MRTALFSFLFLFSVGAKAGPSLHYAFEKRVYRIEQMNSRLVIGDADGRRTIPVTKCNQAEIIRFWEDVRREAATLRGPASVPKKFEQRAARMELNGRSRAIFDFEKSFVFFYEIPKRMLLLSLIQPTGCRQ